MSLAAEARIAATSLNLLSRRIGLAGSGIMSTSMLERSWVN